MSNTQKLSSAVAFLALIAVLDNFIFIELEPGFEKMALIEAGDSQVQADKELAAVEPGLAPFWIDTQVVSQADFAAFVESTGYQPLNLAGNKERLSASPSIDLAHNLTGGASLAPHNSKTAAASDASARVKHEDALAYCNWLGKALPSEAQMEAVTRDGGEGVASSDEYRLLHRDRPPSKTWIGKEHRQEGLVIDAVIASATGNIPSSNHSDNDLLGFLCVKNIDSVKG